ncbi:two-component regulator propeller domain-containing protein [Dyadobacter sp. LHD-138]|uniref:two-component regulator propeller domain-containing protein n=1 Tax=Dyadobacter sp. LHD-138 TaxID=3071413 RepID=UPI0027E10582|nr:two-component regulator propeller domain-containing protein [Dyadobacter sp. LHD-138]MDQ6482123.1 two-component regulator propeller domain-containing protein [Dyadobacter sp. LHD-138]
MFVNVNPTRIFSIKHLSVVVKYFVHLLLVLFLVLCAIPKNCFAQVFQHISDKQGAPGAIVFAASQDPMGFMWFSTTEGLFKYDAHTFRYFGHDPNDSTTLASNYTTSVLCDSRGDVWVCTRSGLCRYDMQSESFQTFKPNDAESGAISSETVYCTIEDKQKNVWIGTANGLDRVELKDGKTNFRHFLQKRPGESAYAVHGIATGANQELWLATSNGLVWFDRGKAKIFKANPDPRLPLINDFTHIFNDASGSIWLGIRKGGMMRFNISSQTFELISSFKSSAGDWPDLSGFAANKHGKVWIATMSGLVNFDVKTLQAEWYVNDPGNDQSLADDVLMSIFKDRQGGLWIGSYYVGLDYMNTSAPAFSRWPFFSNRVTKNAFTNSWMGLTPDQKPWLLAGDKTKIVFYDRVTNQTTSFNLEMEFARNFNHFFVDEQGILWCGGAGVFYSYDFKKGLKKAYKMPNLGRVPIERNDVYTIFQDKHQKLWLGGDAGILSFDKGTSTFRNWVSDKSVESIFEDSGGNIWFGGNNYVGLIRYSKEQVERILLDKNASPEAVLHSSVWRFSEDRKGRIWLASAKGLKYFDPKNNQFRPVSNTFKVLTEGLGDVQADSKGYLWISGGNGLIRFHPDNKTIQSYNDIDGLPRKATLTLRGAAKDDKGTLFFNTSQEMFSFDPQKVLTNNRPESIAMSSLRLFNKTVKANDESGILQQDVRGREELIFRHDQNIFTLNFALLSYARSHENKYRYRLEGFDKDWNEVSVPSATYMNLPSGKYTLVVYAANGDGFWTEKPLKVSIVVLAPWWKTWYAYLFYVLLIAAGLYTVTRFLWIRSLFRRENALNQIKLDFFTNVSHEIRTHLSLISGPLEKAFQQSAEGKNNEKFLGYARNSSDKLLLLVNELLDFRKIQSGSLRLQVREHDVVKIIKSVVAAFEHTANEKDVQTTFVSPETPVMLWLDIAQMQKVFYNLLSNAYKFTPEGGKVAVSVTEISNEVIISVADNGKGISDDHLRKLFTYYYQADSEKPGYGIGLALSKSIVEEHHGYLTAESHLATESSPGGTKLTIRILCENRHFSADQIALKNDGYFDKMLAETMTMPDANNIPHTKQTNTILIIEDNDQLRVFIRELFEGDFKTLEAENGLQGLELANEHIPDIIISDVMMPEMNGLEVCSRLKGTVATSHIPMVLLTARTQNEQIIEGLSAGADDYLVKPFDPRILELKITNLIRLRDDQKKRYRQSVLLDNDAPQSIARDVNEAFIAKLRDLVVENLSDPGFGVNELALQIGMSVSVLYRKMKSLTGMTVNEFVKSIRFNEAKKLLESGIYPVNEVASMIGFEDSKYFSKEFRKIFGKTPNEMKRYVAGS